MLLVCVVAGWCRTFIVCELLLVVVLLFLAVYELVLIVCLEMCWYLLLCCLDVVALAVVLVLFRLFCLWICYNVVKCWSYCDVAGLCCYWLVPYFYCM